MKYNGYTINITMSDIEDEHKQKYNYDVISLEDIFAFGFDTEEDAMAAAKERIDEIDSGGILMEEARRIYIEAKKAFWIKVLEEVTESTTATNGSDKLLIPDLIELNFNNK